ncbi:protein D3-like isoform X1 [Thrips palmi]|uniref:Protein D3-like isoform X1 n=1 Tax=Thrips palmi TaxID=161013 RepID=A0A6P8ZKF1_THRPL|nr:protein D3-like isoform X1 [Thrips palmi]
MECLVPRMLDAVPKGTIKVEYAGGLVVDDGNELTPTQVQHHPTLVTWAAEEGAHYCLICTDFDPPGLELEDPRKNEVIHYMVGNVPGNALHDGEVLFEYIGAGARQGTGLHKYVFLLYKQPGKINFNQERVSKIERKGRLPFSSRIFACQFKLGRPVAGNFFTAQYDDYVPKLHASFID